MSESAHGLSQTLRKLTRWRALTLLAALGIAVGFKFWQNQAQFIHSESLVQRIRTHYDGQDEAVSRVERLLDDMPRAADQAFVAQKRLDAAGVLAKAMFLRSEEGPRLRVRDNDGRRQIDFESVFETATTETYRRDRVWVPPFIDRPLKGF